ncbi:MAG TPA: serine hydrolase [Candidatus Saccharibacteria bacterium]|nr:serine hydrolase [Candidatus Saccharibacteria bacterium]
MNRLKRLFEKSKRWANAHRQLLIRIAIGTVGVIVVAQLLYPADRMLPLDKVGGTRIGGWKKSDATDKLEKHLASQDIKVFIGDSTKAYGTTTSADIGLTMKIDSDMPSREYPFLARLVPSSLWWYQIFQATPAIAYQHDEKQAQKFLEKDLASSCVLPAKDASLKFNGNDFDVVSATNGGTCKESDALAALTTLSPTFSKQANVRIPAKTIKPDVGDEQAEALAKALLANSADGIGLEVKGDVQTISQKQGLSWLSFSSKNSKLVFAVDAKKSKSYFDEMVTPKVSKAAGVSRITTRDFTVISKQVGATGQTLSLPETLDSIHTVLDGTQQTAKAVVATVKPKVVYTRSYTSTSTGISALITHYDEEHAGDFGVAFSELGGQGRSASYQATRQFTTASTYKLFVAYGTLRNVDSGKWKWSMQVQGGRDLTKCFDDMIVKSDNACAEALLKKLGYSKLTNDIRALGLSRSGFVTGDTPLTTAGDLSLFLTKLQNNTIGLKSSSRSTLINAMKRNVYRQGIPAGTSATVADKVGFLNALVHDAAIVYSSKGTYVLTIMTDGSSWANVAELTKKIEALR